MKLFDAVPNDLFSVLASPNRILYADALTVLYDAYRDTLKIPEEKLYSMLRSKLEHQLAEATFEGEDIDEDELRDISGRARFLIRKLCSKGWFEKERGDDFGEYIAVPGYSSRILELFQQITNEEPSRGYSYVFGTYSSLKVIYKVAVDEIGKRMLMTEVVAALIWDKNKFMICQRPANKARGMLWEFVGGKVEPKETKKQALIRECQEELAITISVGEVFMDVVHEYPDLTVHLTLFNAIIANGTPQKLEHNDIRWITVDEIPEYIFCPADETILSKLSSAEMKK